ncbi:MAG: DUF493 domain-containing protein [Chromatiales bacterium]|nr:DUF493 domain-containing protein [Chromatiales bacterium]
MATEDESPLRFPCRFPIKVMGRNTPEFETLVMQTIALHAGESPMDIDRRQSSGGRFVSVTVTITAESRDQLDCIYRSLTASEQVLFAL